MGENHVEVYESRAVAYDLLVAREDHEGHLLPAIQEIVASHSQRSLDQAHVVEPGAGTGRVTRLLAPHVRSLQAFDQAQPMLDIAATHMAQEGHHNVTLCEAENSNLPVETGVADLVIAGWSLCYYVTWGGDDWKNLVDKALQEMKRVCKEDGTIVLIETLGTGYETPHPPDALAPYYAHLTDVWGFQSKSIRTDYRFDDRAEAVNLLGFFFGDERVAKAHAIHEAAGAAPSEALIFPECTGLWWL